MKLSNNALNFLLAQYRAIFKRAYVKGLASAVILTAGLAAGQAQAASASDPFWYTPDNTTWSSGTTNGGESVKHARFAGDFDDGTTDGHNDGIVSGDGLVIGASGDGSASDIVSIASGSAYGGYVSIAEGSSLKAQALGNVLTVKSGATIAITPTSDSLVGGWAKTNGSGVALAQENKLIINAQEGVAITSANQFIGGVAAGNNGATAKDNSYTFTGKSGDKTDISHNGNYGAIVFVGDTAHSGSTGSFEALSNTLDMSNISISGNASTLTQKTFIGGRVWANNIAADNNIDVMRAQGNTVSLSNFTIGSGSHTNGYQSAEIAANYVKNDKNAVDLVEANGSADTGVVLTDGTLNSAFIYGGVAHNISGGAANANNNSVSITNTNLLSSTSGSTILSHQIIGGQAQSTITDATQKVALNASNNTISITNKATDDTTKYAVDGTIRGADLKLSSGGTVSRYRIK